MCIVSALIELTLLVPNKKGAILHTTFSTAFPCMKTFQLRWEFHWYFFLRVQLTISMVQLMIQLQTGKESLFGPSSFSCVNVIWSEWVTSRQFDFYLYKFELSMNTPIDKTWERWIYPNVKTFGINKYQWGILFPQCGHIPSNCKVINCFKITKHKLQMPPIRWLNESLTA